MTRHCILTRMEDSSVVVDETLNSCMAVAAGAPQAAHVRVIDTTDPAQVIVANPHLTEPEAQILAAYASSLDK